MNDRIVLKLLAVAYLTLCRPSAIVAEDTDTKWIQYLKHFEAVYVGAPGSQTLAENLARELESQIAANPEQESYLRYYLIECYVQMKKPEKAILALPTNGERDVRY